MTQRLFKLKGNTSTTTLAKGSVTINGTEVFNGIFSQGSNDEPDGFLCEFAYTFDDSGGVDVLFPVAVTCTTGWAHVGMLKYNYARVVNPTLTPEELAYVNAGTIADAPPAIQADVRSKGGWYIHDSTKFAYGLTPELCYDNRTTEVVDGVPLPEESGHLYISIPPNMPGRGWHENVLHAESVLTFTTIVFSSVDPPAPLS